MKKISTTFLITVFAWFGIHSQSIERDVVASSGDYFENAGVSLSWTLGELAVETYTAGNITLTQGFQQPGGTVSGFALDLKVFLDGPFNGTGLNNTLNTSGFLPLNQPYNTSPWNYNGSESVAAIPDPSVVDWILLELRDAPDAASATAATMVARQAVFILSDGSLTATDGLSFPQFSNPIANELFVVIWHRNHLGIMSANPMTFAGGIYSYDYSTGSGQVTGGTLGYKELAAGLWGMVGGDGNSDNQVSNQDKNDVWAVEAGSSGYLQGDFSMDTQVNNNDKNDVWVLNSGTGGQVPDNGYVSGVPE